MREIPYLHVQKDSFLYMWTLPKLIYNLSAFIIKIKTPAGTFAIM